MNGVIEMAAARLVPLGFMRGKTSLTKIEAGIFFLIEFQKGAHGGGYFFVNLGIHPLGLPMLRTDRLVIPTSPKAHECALRQRIEQIVDGSRFGSARGFFRPANSASVEALLAVLEQEAQQWLRTWGDLERLATAPENEIAPMLSVVPTLRLKAFWMLKCFSLLKLDQLDPAREAFSRYFAHGPSNLSFPHVDDYLSGILSARGVSAT